VEYPITEYVTKRLKTLYSDTIIVIGGIHVYHLEAQINAATDMALRVFQYGFQEGLRRKYINQRNILTIPFPKAKILYWESSGKTPDEVILRLIFSDASVHEYQVETYKVLEHPVEELHRNHLVLLLPFCLLKYRRAVTKTKIKKEWEALDRNLVKLHHKLTELVEDAWREGLLETEDKQLILELMLCLQEELYGDYTNLEEVGQMVEEKLLTFSEQIALMAEEMEQKTAEMEQKTAEMEQKTAEMEQKVEEAVLKAEERIRKDIEKQLFSYAEEATRVRKENAQKMKKDGFSVEQIIKYTGLTREETEGLSTK
jgi:hypothetical protein